jgi:hypothetical protein
MEISVFGRWIKVHSSFHFHRMKVAVPSYQPSPGATVTGEPRGDVASLVSHWVIAQYLSDAQPTGDDLWVECVYHNY